MKASPGSSLAERVVRRPAGWRSNGFSISGTFVSAEESTSSLSNGVVSRRKRVDADSKDSSTMPCPFTPRRSATVPFKWHPDEPPPLIEHHSRAKLTVLRSYLRAYFDRLNVNPHREEFKIDLVDGYTGGGTFRDGAEVISGTPLIMLEGNYSMLSTGTPVRERSEWTQRNTNRGSAMDCRNLEIRPIGTSVLAGAPCRESFCFDLGHAHVALVSDC